MIRTQWGCGLVRGLPLITFHLSLFTYHQALAPSHCSHRTNVGADRQFAFALLKLATPLGFMGSWIADLLRLYDAHGSGLDTWLEGFALR